MIITPRIANRVNVLRRHMSALALDEKLLFPRLVRCVEVSPTTSWGILCKLMSVTMRRSLTSRRILCLTTKNELFSFNIRKCYVKSILIISLPKNTLK